MSATNTVTRRHMRRHFAAIERDHQQWPLGIAALRAYRTEHGHSAVPLACIHEGFALGPWLGALRRDRRLGHPRVGADRIAELDTLGMIWGSHDIAWQRLLHELRLFRAQYRHLAVSNNYRARNGFRLGARVVKLRTDRRQGNPVLTRARIAELDALGMWWN